MRPDFPRNLPEFLTWFGEERRCWEYVVESRWPDGHACPRCQSPANYFVADRRLFECQDCSYQTSVTAGTIMHRTKLPLAKWLLAACFVTTDKRGISAKFLARQLGVGYETAWGLLHKLRAAMVAPQREKLHGFVEIDETEIGSPKRGRVAEETPEKMIVVGAVERLHNPKNGRHYAGRARLLYLPNGRKKEDLLDFVVKSVRGKSWIVTDAAPVYTANLPQMDYHSAVESTTLGHKPGDVLPLFHIVASNLKSWLNGTHHGAVSAKHLQAYCNEFVFRFNRRGSPQAAFQTILGICGKKRGPEIDQMYLPHWCPGAWVTTNPSRGKLAS